MNTRLALSHAKKCGISKSKARAMIAVAIKERDAVRACGKISSGGCSFTSESLVYGISGERVGWQHEGWDMDDGAVELRDGSLYDGHAWMYNVKTGCIFDPTQDQFKHYHAPGPPEQFFVAPGTFWWKRYHGWRSNRDNTRKYLDTESGEIKPPYRRWDPNR